MSKEVEAALNYLHRLNRPCSYNDVCQSIANEFSKTAIQKALSQLVSESKIKEKIYNKQKIYSVIQKPVQDKIDVQNAVQVCELEILKKTNELKKHEQELKSAGNELSRYTSTLTLKEAQEKKTELQISIKNLENKLSELSKNTTSISKADRDKVERDYNTAVKMYKSRKRICTDILDSILENYPKKKSVLIEEIGLELDDEENTPPLAK